MIYNHSRWQIWAQLQHPYKHVLSDLAYANPALPGGAVVNAQQAMDWLVTVVYPQTKPAVATPADLPTVGNTINDYRIVNDNGNGKAAAYRWLQTEGMAAPAWVQLYEMDWGVDSILEQATNVAQGIFVKADGHDDVDGTNTPVAGTYAGQRIFGGASAGTNLTLTANNGDGAGSHTGFVQSDNTFRPTATGTYDLGTLANKWQNAYLSGSVFVGTMTLTSGSITDTSGTIDFGSDLLQTTGNAHFGAGHTLQLASGTIVDTTGTISFGSTVLITTGNFQADNGTFTGTCQATSFTGTATGSGFAGTTTFGGTLELSTGTIVDTTLAISFGGCALSTTGTITAGFLDAKKLTLTNVGTLTLDPQAKTFTASADLTISATSLTVPDTTGPTFTATSKFSGPEVDIGTSVLTVSGLNFTTGATFTLTGTTLVHDVTTVRPATDAVTALGDAAHRYTNLFLSGGVSDGTNTASIATLMSLRNVNVGVADGYVLVYQSSTGTWVSKDENAAIDHHRLENLTAFDDHTQYALLGGRAGGQLLIGGTAASDNLNLSSTSNGTKGTVQTDSTFIPTITNLCDLGSGTNGFRDLYLTGTAKLAIAAGGGLIVGTAGQIGQLWYNTSTYDLWLDDGSGTNYLRKISVDRYYNQDAVNWNGTQKTVTYNVSRAAAGATSTGWVSDARQCVWALKDNANGFEQTGATITMTQTTVTVTVDIALPSGTYTLVGVG